MSDQEAKTYSRCYLYNHFTPIFDPGPGEDDRPNEVPQETPEQLPQHE